MTPTQNDLERLRYEALEEHEFQKFYLGAGCKCGWRTQLLSAADIWPAWCQHMEATLRLLDSALGVPQKPFIAYEGQEFFHEHNANIKRAELAAIPTEAGAGLREEDLKAILSHCIYDPVDVPLAVAKLNQKLAALRASPNKEPK